jgi:hypothetical protein
MQHFFNQPHMGENWFTYPHLYSHVVKKFPTNSHFVELGSWKGMSAAFMAVEIINSSKNIRFDCIDIWSPDGYLSDQTQKEFGDELMQCFLTNIEPVKHVINVIRKDSAAAAADYADHSLDFVFIDADHSYEGVKKDILAWLPKMKPDGILAGHDYAWHEPIRQAVSDVFGAGDYSDPWGNGCFVFNMVNGKPMPFNQYI